MSTQRYSPVRSAIILTLSFLLPLLLSFYSNQLSEFHTSLWHPKQHLPWTSSRNATGQISPLFAQQMTVCGLTHHNHSIDTYNIQEDASRMLTELRRDTGKWNANHPRYRLLSSMMAFMRYGEDRTTELDTWRKRYKILPRSQRTVRSIIHLKTDVPANLVQSLERTIGYTNKLNTVEDLMIQNAGLAEDILDHGLRYYGIPRSELEEFVQDLTNGTNKQKGSTLYAMKHFVRDWSDDGLHERQATYPCVLQAVQTAFPKRSDSEQVRILVPGSGLGRLGHEIAALGGFQVTLNEFSYSMNIAYHYLTSLKASNVSTIHPYVDWWSHRATTAHLVRPVHFPDNAKLLAQPSVSLVEGEFTTALKPHEGSYDALVSHFFIDTATNILTYLETMHAMLKPGGIWINFGPLLYGSMPALQLSLDEVIAMAESVGFELEQPSDACGDVMEFDSRVRGAHVPYAYDTESLSRNAYLAQHWVARKKL